MKQDIEGERKNRRPLQGLQYAFSYYLNRNIKCAIDFGRTPGQQMHVNLCIVTLNGQSFFLFILPITKLNYMHKIKTGVKLV